MPRGCLLSAAEQNFLLGAKDSDTGERRTVRNIQQLLQQFTGQSRSLCVIHRFLSDPEHYGSGAAKAGRKQKFTGRFKRAVVSEALDNPARGVRGVASSLQKISKSSVHRILQADSHIVLAAAKAKPALRPHHKLHRLQWATSILKDRTDLANVIWTDEKRFNLDGPDFYSQFWYDLRKETPRRVSRRFGGGSVMFWGAFSASGIRCIVKVDGSLNAERYKQLLQQNLVPLLPRRRQQLQKFVFQQDNAAPHTAKSTIEFLHATFASVMEWPALSPDLNPIENVWGVMARDLYAGNKQYATLPELEAAVMQSWSRIGDNLFRTLSDSVSDRAVQVLRANGGSIDF